MNVPIGRSTVLAFSLIATPNFAHACDLPQQSDGRVAAVIDPRTLRLDDGREVRLDGLAPLAGDHASIATGLLGTLVTGHAVTIHALSDAPDRYGRQVASVRLDTNGPSVQAMLAAQGGAIADGHTSDACADDVRTGEADARLARLGIWARDGVIKSANNPDDLRAITGRFAIVEGRVSSVRQAGTVTYVNFGRRWTQDFTVTISGRALPLFEAAALKPQIFERQKLRVRGIIEHRGGGRSGPRIEALRPAQIEIVGGDAVAGASE